MFPSPPETASQTSSSVGEYSPQSEAMSPDVMEGKYLRSKYVTKLKQLHTNCY